MNSDTMVGETALRDWGPYDLGTVFYSGDAELLRYHAMSIVRNGAHDEIGTIHLAWNDESALDEVLRARVIEAYGPLAKRVRIHTRESLGARVDGMKGWHSQQVLKLLLGDVLEAQRVVLLDTKNLFVRPVRRAHFFDNSGRPVSFLTTKSEQQRKWARHSRALFGLPPLAKMHPDKSVLLPPTITPYPIRSDDLRGTVRAIEARAGSVSDLFARKNFQGSEFFLIYAYLVSDGSEIESHFALSGPRIPTLFTRWPEEESVAIEVCRDVLKGHSPFFSVHPSRKGRLAGQLAAKVRRIWQEAGLPVDELATYYEMVLEKAEAEAAPDVTS